MAAIDYTTVLADLEAKRDELDKAITGIRAMLGIARSPPCTADRGILWR